MATVKQQPIPFNPVTITLVTKEELKEMIEIFEEAPESDISDASSNLAIKIYQDLVALLK